MSGVLTIEGLGERCWTTNEYWHDMFCAAIESMFEYMSLAKAIADYEAGLPEQQPREDVFKIECGCCGKKVFVNRVNVCWQCGNVECWDCNDENESGEHCETCGKYFCDCIGASHCFIGYKCDNSREYFCSEECLPPKSYCKDCDNIEFAGIWSDWKCLYSEIEENGADG